MEPLWLKKHDIAKSSTDYSSVLKGDDVDLVIITTRHNLHASMVVEALKNNKHVFVEKPLALNNAELDLIDKAYSERYWFLNDWF